MKDYIMNKYVLYRNVIFCAVIAFDIFVALSPSFLSATDPYPIYPYEKCIAHQIVEPSDDGITSSCFMLDPTLEVCTPNMTACDVEDTIVDAHCVGSNELALCYINSGQYGCDGLQGIYVGEQDCNMGEDEVACNCGGFLIANYLPVTEIPCCGDPPIALRKSLRKSVFAIAHFGLPSYTSQVSATQRK